MLAGDLTLGGFAGATGALSASVQLKKRMLESDGVVFDAKGRAEAHALHSFDRAGGGSGDKGGGGGKGSGGKGSVKGGKRQRTSTAGTSDEVSIGMLRESILKVLTKRGPKKTC